MTRCAADIKDRVCSRYALLYHYVYSLAENLATIFNNRLLEAISSYENFDPELFLNPVPCENLFGNIIAVEIYIFKTSISLCVCLYLILGS